MGRVLKIILTFAVICTVFYIVLLFKIYHQGQTAVPQKSDAIILLGCQVKEHGTPSLLLQYRLEKALQLYKENYASQIIVSGGKGTNEPMTEASAMASWLETHGVPKHSILLEDKSTSTYENLQFSKAIMERVGLKSAIIVSNDFHIYRALKIADKLNIHATGAPAPTLDYLKAYYYSREVLSVIKYFILGS